MDKYPDMSAIYEIQFAEEQKLKDKIKELETQLSDAEKAIKLANDSASEWQKNILILKYKI